ncbi:PSP1 domain-containing protein [Microlunatus ginsengisoli]|uniref:Stage 0 sporulation family protein n=1 Tax=Microlunatus ginsengisoli TaxID=363863 RepID=A0ABP7AF49_9ACTN
MGRVMAVSFERYGRLYYLDPGEGTYAVGDRVLVPTESGPEVAECVWAPEWVDDAETGFVDLPVCAGKAGDEALARDEENRRRRAEAKLVAKKLIKRHELPMKVVGVDYVDSGEDFDELVVVYFTAPHRVDFRALVGELARTLRARIDLRQVGSRDAARLVGGLGNCGRDLCCATFLNSFEPVSLRMAKVQDLPPNPMKISGACGRLMCCLKYEHPLYVDFARQAPAVGSRVSTDEGDGVVVAHQVPADSVLVRVAASGAMTSCALATVCGSRQAYEGKDRDAVRTGRDDPADPLPAEAVTAAGAAEDPAPGAGREAAGGRMAARGRGRRRRARDS